jgi:hypothetical protein
MRSSRLGARIDELEQKMNASAEPIRISVIYEDHNAKDPGLSDAVLEALWSRYGYKVEVIPPEGHKRDLREFSDEGEGLRRELCESEDPAGFVSSLSEDDYHRLMRSVGYFVTVFPGGKTYEGFDTQAV